MAGCHSLAAMFWAAGLRPPFGRSGVAVQGTASAASEGLTAGNLLGYAASACESCPSPGASAASRGASRTVATACWFGLLGMQLKMAPKS